MNKGFYSIICLLSLLALPGCWPSKEEKAPEAVQQEVPAATMPQEVKEVQEQPAAPEAVPAPAEQKPAEAQPAAAAPAKI